MARRRIRRRGGTVSVTLTRSEADLLAGIATELRALFESPPAGDAVTDRLFPRAYLDPTEEAAEQTWQAFVHPDLLRDRLDGVAALLADLEPGTEDVRVDLDGEGQARWLGVLNDARLALGTRLGVTEETPLADPADPDAFPLVVYEWLGSLLADLVDVLLGGMPEGGID